MSKVNSDLNHFNSGKFWRGITLHELLHRRELFAGTRDQFAKYKVISSEINMMNDYKSIHALLINHVNNLSILI